VIRIQRSILQEMITHAREAFPLECCGLLIGKGRHIWGIRRATNQLARPDAFFIPPEELFDFFRFLRATGQDLAGIYHSHPHGPPIPSKRDVAEFHYHESSYWVISLAGEPDIRCYQWGTMTFDEIEFETVD